MDGGRIARIGFHYQDLGALWLWLRTYVAAITSGKDLSESRIGVEVTTGAKTSWDIVYALPGEPEDYWEAKSGKISLEDKSIFWKRVRIQAAKDGTMRVGWIIDTVNFSFAEKLKQLRANAQQLRASDIPKQLPKTQIRSWKTLGKNALYWLCKAPLTEFRESQASPLTLRKVKDILLTLKIEVISQKDLENRVEQCLLTLQPDNFPEAVLFQLKGYLDKQAREPEREGFVDCKHVFKKIEVLFGDKLIKSAHAFIKYCWDITDPICNGKINTGGLKLQNMASILSTEEESQLSSNRLGLFAILGHAGSGKSTLAKLLIQSSKKDHYLSLPKTLYVSSFNLTKYNSKEMPEAIDTFWRAVRILSNFGAITVVFDGLDEIDRQYLEHLAQRLRSLCEQQNIKLIVTCRKEVWISESSLAYLRESSALQSLDLQDWSEDLVKHIVCSKTSPAYVASINADLMKVLRTPFFLDLFVQLLDRRQELLAIKTHVDLLKKYKEVRIDNSRSGETQKTHGGKVKRKACKGLIQRCLKGELSFDLDSYQGNQALLDHSILERTCGDRVRFRHRLLQHFLAADYLIGVATQHGVQNSWKKLHKLQDPSIRAEVIHFLLALGFSDEQEEMQHVAAGWISYATNQQKNDMDIFCSTIYAYSKLSPALYPKCSSILLKSEKTSVLTKLLKYLRAAVRMEDFSLGHAWWDHAICLWEVGDQVGSGEMLHELTCLAEVLFREDSNPVPITAEKRHQVGKLLLKWSSMFSTEDIEKGMHRWLLEITCQFLAHIPAPWLSRMTQSPDMRIRGKAAEYLCKLEDKELLGPMLLELCGITRVPKAMGEPQPWLFSQTRPWHSMMEYDIIETALSEF